MTRLLRFALRPVRSFLPRRASLMAVPVIAILAVTSPAAAGQPVTMTLNPPATDIYVCRATGSGAICDAHTVEPYELEPTGIFCPSGGGVVELLDTGTRIVHAKRFYDRDGNLTRRERVLRFVGLHLTNPATGRTVSYKQHNTDWDVLAVPGDFSSTTFYGHGHMTITIPGRGLVSHDAGMVVVSPDGDVLRHGGPSDLGDYFAGDTTVVAELCAALA